MKLTYKHTRYACYMAYITGAIVNNFAPLLFVIFQNDYNVTTIQLSHIISTNFGVQLIVDLLSSGFVEKIGHRRVMQTALFMSLMGLVCMGILPGVIPPFAGIMISVVCYAIGSGLLEVMVSPTIEALPSDTKTSDMSILHSFYCWGSMLVIIVSTMFFKLFGTAMWKYLSVLWAIVPLVTILMFIKVPIVPFGGEEGSLPIKKIFSGRMFRLFFLVMLCAGASEIAMSQWSSFFAEKGLGVSKTLGDLLGPCMFAFAMGLARLLFGKHGERFDTFKVLPVAGLICVCGYLITVFSQNPIISLVGCGIVGFGSAIMWPGTLSLAAKHCSEGGVALFGLLAMGGDVGCTVGPKLVAEISRGFSIYGSPIKAGLLAAIVFPLALMTLVFVLKKMSKQKKISG